MKKGVYIRNSNRNISSYEWMSEEQNKAIALHAGQGCGAPRAFIKKIKLNSFQKLLPFDNKETRDEERKKKTIHTENKSRKCGDLSFVLAENVSKKETKNACKMLFEMLLRDAIGKSLRR